MLVIDKNLISAFCSAGYERLLDTVFRLAHPENGVEHYVSLYGDSADNLHFLIGIRTVDSHEFANRIMRRFSKSYRDFEDKFSKLPEFTRTKKYHCFVQCPRWNLCVDPKPIDFYNRESLGSDGLAAEVSNLINSCFLPFAMEIRTETDYFYYLIDASNLVGMPNYLARAAIILYIGKKLAVQKDSLFTKVSAIERGVGHELLAGQSFDEFLVEVWRLA